MRVHQSRPRRECVGDLVQIDGSPHDWFEGRGPACTLIVYVDDATTRLLAVLSGGDDCGLHADDARASGVVRPAGVVLLGPLQRVPGQPPARSDSLMLSIPSRDTNSTPSVSDKMRARDTLTLQKGDIAALGILGHPASHQNGQNQKGRFCFGEKGTFLLCVDMVAFHIDVETLGNYSYREQETQMRGTSLRVDGPPACGVALSRFF